MTKKLHVGLALTASLLASGAVLAPSAFAQRGNTPSPAVQTPAAELITGAPESAWIEISPENLLVMDLPSGELLIELRPDLAPAHVERIRTLTLRGFYDGTPFHRVIEGFMAQGGDPTGTGQGDSDLPDLEGEFAYEAATIGDFVPMGRDDRAATIGFVGTVPMGGQAPTLGTLLENSGPGLWGLHCQGVMSMARTSNPNSANSQFFLMFGDRRDSLDAEYTVWGKIVDGYRNARRINRGEPPARPTPVVRMRMMTQLPAEEQVRVERFDTRLPEFREWLVRTGQMSPTGFFDDVCAIDVPVRIGGEIRQ